MSRLKVGDIVSVNDGAWSDCLNKNGRTDMIRVRRWFTEKELQRWRIIGVGCKIPLVDTMTANTLIISEQTRGIFAINECNLSAWVNVADVGIQFVANGKDVTAELSNISKVAVLRAHWGSLDQR